MHQAKLTATGTSSHVLDRRFSALSAPPLLGPPFAPLPPLAPVTWPLNRAPSLDLGTLLCNGIVHNVWRLRSNRLGPALPSGGSLMQHPVLTCRQRNRSRCPLIHTDSAVGWPRSSKWAQARPWHGPQTVSGAFDLLDACSNMVVPVNGTARRDP